MTGPAINIKVKTAAQTNRAGSQVLQQAPPALPGHHLSCQPRQIPEKLSDWLAKPVIKTNTAAQTGRGV